MHFNFRQKIILSILTGVLMLGGCKGNVLDWRNAQINNGKVYAGDASKPFSGRVTNAPSNAIFMRQPGYQQLFGQTNILIMNLYGTSLLCDAELDDGVLDGDVICKRAESDVAQMKAHFKKGGMVGVFVMFSKSGSDPVLEANFEDGKLNGETKAYSQDTGKMISRQSFKDGKNEGVFKQWDPKTGNLLVEANYDHGVLDGEYIKKDVNDNVLTKGRFADGKFTGTENAKIGTGDIIAPYMEFVKKKILDGAVQNQTEIDATIRFVSDVNQCVYTHRNEFYARTRNFPTREELPPLVEECKRSVQAGNKSETEPSILSAVAGEDKTVNAYISSIDPGQSTGQVSAKNAGRNDWPTEGNACTIAWEKAFHKANGDNAPVTSAQAWEFVDNCRAGRNPV